VFNRSFLPPALFEFVVVADTHYIRDPDIYASGSDSQDPRFTRDWPARADRALQLAAALEPAFVVHLGDLAQEFPGKADFEISRQEALAQIRGYGLRPYHTPGNMDIGDKPNPTVPADWVTAETLAQWHAQFGCSWYAFDHAGVHGVVLNSQIMNGPLPEAAEQQRWLEADLAEHAGQRIFLFLHMPPFFVDVAEPGVGAYNSLDEPARAWLLGLLREFAVEFVFSGHTHFAALNRHAATRLYITPSTTTSRPGFVEVFSVLPPHQGKNDLAKLGFYLVRVHEDDARIHVIRTQGGTGAAEAEAGAQRLLTGTTRDLPDSPLGVHLRLPLAPAVAGVATWPDAVRQPVRDDYPLLACLEMGARHLRLPAGDLHIDVQRRRLCVARDEGLQVAAAWLWTDGLDLVEAIVAQKDEVDSIEIQVAGGLWPDADCLHQIEQLGHAAEAPVTLAPLLAREPVPGKYHPRLRVGYRPEELAELNDRLARHGVRLDRALCHIAAETPAWEGIQAFRQLLPLSQVGNLDFVMPLPGLDETAQAVRAAEAMLASALAPGCRLFLDPLVDVDRSSDIHLGLLDRLSNPRPAFHVVRCLNTLVFGSREGYAPLSSAVGGRVIGLEGRTVHVRLLSPGEPAPSWQEAFGNAAMAGREWLWVDLVHGAIRRSNAPTPEVAAGLTLLLARSAA
jgi:hypothetical protein